MTDTNPIHRTREVPGANVDDELAELAHELRHYGGGFTVVGGDDAETNARVCDGLAGQGLVPGGEIRRERMQAIASLRRSHALTLLATPVLGHAKSVEHLIETALAAGAAIEPESVLHSVQAVGAREPCPACHGHWAATPRAMLLERYGERLVDTVEQKLAPEERSRVRTWPQGRTCARCHGEPAWTFAFSRLGWTWELMELLRRDGGERLDRALARERYRWTSTAVNALVKVALGEAGPEVLGEAALEDELDAAQLRDDIRSMLRAPTGRECSQARTTAA